MVRTNEIAHAGGHGSRHDDGVPILGLDDRLLLQSVAAGVTLVAPLSVLRAENMPEWPAMSGMDGRSS
jgi:hypothetical protein